MQAWLTAVSYTHLDVYKRQSRGCPDGCERAGNASLLSKKGHDARCILPRDRIVLVGQRDAREHDLFERRNRADFASHGDVYKRQTLLIPH